jgi:GNAT superfamily N-acetyltransferase
MIINPEAIVNTERVTLPEGYVYAVQGSITDAELEAIDEAVYGPFDNEFQSTMWPMDVQQGPVDFRFKVVVRPEGEEHLVGIGYLFVADYPPSREEIGGVIAELAYLMVRPDHQRRGIGSVILSERLRIAEGLGATAISIDELAPTNTLRSKYLKYGFKENVHGNLRRQVNRSRE